MSLVHVSVTQEDIDHGERANPGRCAMDLAIRRATGLYALNNRGRVKLYDASVISFQPKGYTILPEAAHMFVLALDNEEPVTPIEFDLEVPE